MTRNKKKTGRYIRRMRDLNEEFDTLDKKISDLKQNLRKLKQEQAEVK